MPVEFLAPLPRLWQRCFAPAAAVQPAELLAAPPAGTVYRSYYYAGGVRVALREQTSTSDTLYYLLSDQLGSTTITANGSGGYVSELRYKPWGEVRYSNGTTPTLRRFTGEPFETATGLYWVGSRLYDPALSRWVQADSLVPDPGYAQAWDRYAYVYNSPLNYIDPSGHRTCTARQADTGDETCDQNIPNTADELIQAGIAGTGITWNQLSQSDKAIFVRQSWTPENYSIEFITGNAIDISGTYEDPAVWLVGLIGAGKLTPSVISLLKEFFKPEEVTGTTLSTDY